jgi:ADP-ribosylglycohydrolase
MLGAVIGDIVGSVYEFDNYRSKDFEPFFHTRSFFTDDTICIVAVADALLSGEHPAKSLKAWGRRYWENGGWGQGFARWLRSDDSEPYGSYGNGAAMRVAPAGLLGRSLEQTLQLAASVTEVTHNHPEGMKGAAATAMAIFLARSGIKPRNIQHQISERFGYDLATTVDEIRPHYHFNESCQGTVPQALVCALTATSFEDAIRNAISIGGDSDTVAAIAGGVAEALFGIPDDIAQHGWRYLPRDMRMVLTRLYRAAEAATGTRPEAALANVA